MLTLAEDYHRTSIKIPSPLLTGLDAKLHSFVGVSLGRGRHVVAGLLRQGHRIDRESAALRDRSDSALRSRILEYRDALRRRKRGYDETVPEALAAVAEAAARRLGLRPFPVQLAGSLALYNGYVAEMSVGEGKTLTAALTAVIRGWMGQPCHIITVNDYLASRDSRWMAPLYRFCEVTVGCVTGGMESAERQEGHRGDVTYTTSKEIVADFLRDRLWLGRLQQAPRRQISAALGRRGEIDRGLVMRGIHTAIVDEADSILIDEAVTPLIISKVTTNEAFVEACRIASDIAAGLVAGSDYRVDRKYRDIELTESARRRIADHITRVKSAYRALGGYLELVQQALSARELFRADEQYVVQDGKVVIVDEFTGRQMPQRTWRAGLHQFVEAKEHLEMTPPTETLARLSFQRFFRFFQNLSGMTGTARESAKELWDIYELPVLTVPENRPTQRKLLPPAVFADRDSKWQAIVEEIRHVHQTGRPVLVGTRSVAESEHLARLLSTAGLSYQLLNAVRHREEAGIVAVAGEPGTITIATNMAGRGTDIRLGKGVADLGGLHVVATECHESQRIDRQLFGRCARQGDPGSARLMVCMEDEIIRRYLPGAIRRSISAGLANGLAGSRTAGLAAIRLAQRTAQRLAYRQRRSVLKMDTWLEDSLSFAYREVS